MEQAIEEVRLPKSVIPTRYSIHYEDIDLTRWTFSGYVDIELEVKEETDFVMLNAKELAIHSASITVDDNVTDIDRILVLKNHQRVAFQLEKKLIPGKAMLHVVFSGILNDYMQGFYRSRYTVDGQEKYMATTQFESTDARMAFPCWDEPALKARFRIWLTTPLGYTAVSNMPAIKKLTIDDHGVKKNLYEFDETPIMSTYLVAFVIGEFDMISGFSSNGIQVNCFTPLGKSSWGEFALQVGLHAIAYYAKFFDIPYPLKKLDLLPIPDFAAGAMENWGCVTFREVDLLIDSSTASIANRKRVALVVAHEIAHMWFGDLVTMEWWTHLWLNEGFASYMEYLCVDALFPHWRMVIEFYNDSVSTALYDDSFTSSHPIEIPVKYPDEIDQIFDGISYNKGSAVIQQLVSFIGEKAFREGMHIYLSRHQFGNTCTEDLWRALGEGSNMDCEEIMKKWTQEAGYPILVLTENEGHSIESAQYQYYSNPAEEVKESDWKIPLAIITPDHTEQFLFTNETKQEFNHKISSLIKQHAYVKLNQTSLVIVQYPPSMLSSLKTAVMNQSISPLDRIQLLKDMHRLCNSQRITPNELCEFIEGYVNETDWSVMEVLVNVLMSIASYVRDEIREAYKVFVKKMVVRMVDQCGWDVKEEEDVFETAARPGLLSLLCSVCEEDDVRGEALRRFELLMKHGDETTCHTEIRLLCMKEGVKSGDESVVSHTVTELMKKYETTTGAEKRRIIAAVGQARFPSVIRRILGFTLDGTIRKQDTYTCFASVCRNRKYKKLCWEYLKEKMGEIHDSLKGSFNMMGYFVEAGGSVLDEQEELEEFRAFFAKEENNLKEVSQSIKIAEQNIMMNISKKKFMEEHLKEYFAYFVCCVEGLSDLRWS